MIKGIRALQFGMAPAAFAACNATGGASAGTPGGQTSSSAEDERCAYPDMVQGAWNETLTYKSPTMITLPHFYKVPAPCRHSRIAIVRCGLCFVWASSPA